jgi:hypothetical protein
MEITTPTTYPFQILQVTVVHALKSLIKEIHFLHFSASNYSSPPIVALCVYSL